MADSPTSITYTTTYVDENLTGPIKITTGNVLFENCTFTGTTKGTLTVDGNAIVDVVGCTFTVGAKSTSAIFESMSGGTLNFIDCSFTIDKGSNNGSVFGCEEGSHIHFYGSNVYAGQIQAEQQATIFGDVGKNNASSRGGDIVINGNFEFQTTVDGNNIVLGDNAVAIFTNSATFGSGTQISIKSDSVKIIGEANSTIENVTFLLPEAYEPDYEIKLVGFGIETSGSINAVKNISNDPYRLRHENGTDGNTLAALVTNHLDADNGIVFGYSPAATGQTSSGYTYDENIGTYQAANALHINGEENSVTLHGTYNTNGYRTYIHNLTFDGTFNSAPGGELYIDNVTMNAAGRIYGGGYTDVRGNIQGAIYASGKNVASADAIQLVINNNETHTASYGNIFGGASITDGSTSFTLSTVDMTINGGSFNKFTGNGTLIKAANTGNGVTTTQAASTLTINGGTFNSTVYAGGYSNGNMAAVNGDINLTITGGTFIGNVLGGCLADKTDNAKLTTVTGDINITISGGEFRKWLVAGSRGKGMVNGNTCLTFKGEGSNISFVGSEAYIIGCSAMFTNNDKSAASFAVTGTTTLAFDGFSGLLGGIVRDSFTNVSIVNNSYVSLGQNNYTMLSMVDTWNFEIGTNNINGNPLLAFGTHEGNVCDLTNDTINLTFGNDALLAEGASIALIDFGAIDLASLNYEQLTAINITGDTLTLSEGTWTGSNYTAYLSNDNKLMLAAK